MCLSMPMVRSMHRAVTPEIPERIFSLPATPPGEELLLSRSRSQTSAPTSRSTPWHDRLSFQRAVEVGYYVAAGLGNADQRGRPHLLVSFASSRSSVDVGAPSAPPGRACRSLCEDVVVESRAPPSPAHCTRFMNRAALGAWMMRWSYVEGGRHDLADGRKRAEVGAIGPSLCRLSIEPTPNVSALARHQPGARS